MDFIVTDHLIGLHFMNLGTATLAFLINSGVKSLTIAERLGHSKEMVERVYGHLFPSERQEIFECHRRFRIRFYCQL